MNNTALFIPEQIRVGFQNRNDTYTGKLAYVIYFDEKGKLRKETSWENWRDASIAPETFANVPISGFSLNKKVGDYTWHFHRMAYIRVYDPRGFEFEISLQNLLYILEYSTCNPGKVLDGEFVYAWDGPELVLLPTNAKEYQTIQAYTNKVKKSEFIKPKDFKVGYVYTTSKNQKYIYLGYFDYYDYGGNAKKLHQFISPEQFDNVLSKNDPDLIFTTNYASLNKRFMEGSNKPVDDIRFCTFFELLRHCSHFSPVDPTKEIFVKYTIDEFERQVAADHFYSETFYSDELPDVRVYRDNQTPRGMVQIITSNNNRQKNNLYNYDGTVYFSIRDVFDMLKPYYKKCYLSNGYFHHYIAYSNYATNTI